jgi:PAS domain S-box-containing protein
MAGDITRVADQVVTIIAELLDIKVSLVERLEDETILTITLYDHGKLVHEGKFPLKGTPCERVKVDKKQCIYNNHVAELFPEDPFFEERGLVAYIGVPVLDSQGEVIGVVNAMDDRPRDFSPDDLTLLYTLAHRIGIEIERAKAEKLVDRRNKELTALYGITSTVSRSLDVDRILNDALDELLRLEPFKAEAGAKIFLLDMEKEMLTVAASRHMPTDHPCHKKPVKLGECLCGLAAKKGELIISDTAHLDERHTLRWPNMPPHKDVCVPIKYKDKVFGVLDIWLPTTTEVTEEEITLLKAIGSQIGVAIENARLYEKAQQRLSKLMALDNIHHAIISTLNMDEILSIFLENVIEISQADAATVMLMRPGSDILETIASRAEGGKSKATLKLKGGEGLAGWVAREGLSLIVNDVKNDPRFHCKDVPERMRIVSYLGIPLKVQGKVIGVLNISAWHRREFTTEEVDFFTTMSSEVAMAIENARLYGQIEKRAQELNRDLLGQKQYAENVLRSITDGVYTVDTNRVVQSWSKGAEVITGYTAEETIGRPCANFLHHTNEAGQVLCDTDHCPFKRVWATSKPIEPEPVFLHQKNGNILPVAVTAASILDEQGQAMGAVEVFRDVSKEQELVKNLQEASRAKSEFLTKMSHELRTPLNSVIGFAQVLLRQHFGPLTDKQKEYLRDIYESGDHLLSLINDILDLSKIEVGKLTLGIKKIALGPKIERALVFVREKAIAHGITLEMKISEDLPAVFADERAVLQILVNLLSNAVKFTPDGGRVEIKSYPQGDFVAVDVLDTGMGIAIEDQKKIFRLFEQLSVSSP